MAAFVSSDLLLVIQFKIFWIDSTDKSCGLYHQETAGQLLLIVCNRYIAQSARLDFMLARLCNICAWDLILHI